MEYLGFSSQLPLFNILLPVGISFYTFQTMSYSIDVYRGALKAERHLGFFALYVSFFPQLVAGPIVRYSEIDQDLMHRVTSKSDFAHGMERFVHGLAKKINPGFSVFCSNPTDGRYNHPDGDVVKDFLPYNPIQVDTKNGAHFTGLVEK